MLPSFLLALREGIEAALIIGILFGALRRLNVPQLSASIWWGVISASVVSLLVAVGLTAVGAELKGPAEPIFEGVMMLAAAALLTWMIFWMYNQSQHLRGKIEEDIRQALKRSDGGRADKRALFGVAFLAVVREGIELALFLVAAGLAADSSYSLLGALLGLVAAFGLGWIIFFSTRRLQLKTFFRVTNFLLILFAAGLASRAVHEFNEVGWIPSVIDPLYNLNPIFSDTSTLGQVLKALFGYNGNPSFTEAFAYLAYFAILGFMVFRIQRGPAEPVRAGNSAYPSNQ